MKKRLLSLVFTIILILSLQMVAFAGSLGPPQGPRPPGGGAGVSEPTSITLPMHCE